MDHLTHLQLQLEKEACLLTINEMSAGDRCMNIKDDKVVQVLRDRVKEIDAQLNENQ